MIDNDNNNIDVVISGKDTVKTNIVNDGKIDTTIQDDKNFNVDVQNTEKVNAEVAVQESLDAEVGSTETVAANIENSGELNTTTLETGTATSYNQLISKPKINGVELIGNKTTEELKINGDTIKVSDTQTLNQALEKVVTEAELAEKGYMTSYTETDPTVPAHVKRITEVDIARWNSNEGAFDGDYNKLENKPYIPTMLSDLNNDMGFITEEDIDIPTKVSDLANDTGFITADIVPVNLSQLANDEGFITLDTVEEQGYLKEYNETDPVYNSEKHLLATKEEVNAKPNYSDLPTKTSQLQNDSGFLTEHQEVATVAKTGSYNDLKNKPTIPSKTSQLTNDSDFITNAQVEAKGYLTEHQSLADYAKKNEIPTKVSQLNNDSNYTTMAAVEAKDYTTLAEVAQQGYLTEHQDLSDYAKTEDLPTNVSELTNDANYITAEANVASATKAIQDGNGKVIADTYLPLAGGTLTGALTPNGGIKHVGKDGYIMYPEGGSCRSGAPSSIGYLKITLPVSWTATMLKFTISIFNYAKNTSVDYIVSGYTYNAPNDCRWVHPTAVCIGKADSSLSNLPVIFGHDGTKCAILIGTPTTTWSYLQAQVHNVIVGLHSETYDVWKSNWNIGVTTTALSTANYMITNTHVGYGSSAAFATSATNADNATNATHATTADSAVDAESAASAQSAVQDSEGQTISETYIKNLSVNGNVITYTRGDDTTGNITTQDTNTTYSTATSTTNGLMAKEDKAKLDTIQEGAQVNTITGVKGNSESSYRTGNINITKANIGLGNVENKTSATIRGELTASNVTTALGFTPLNSNLKGKANGLAELDAEGKVPAAQLPSFVDDVLEYSSKSSFPATGETGKIYVDTSTNLTYRWSGSTYVAISSDLALGETSSTAYRGDRGKTAYDHSQIKDGNPHGTDLADLGVTASATELNYVDGVTSSIQTQLNGKAPTSHASSATTYGAASASNYGHAKASGTTPKANGTAAVGSETATFARGDHVHPLQTTVSGNAGTATKLATARTINGVSFDGTANITVADATKLPLSGGNLTGNLTINSGTTTPFKSKGNLHNINKNLTWNGNSYISHVILLLPVLQGNNLAVVNYFEGKFMLWKHGANIFDTVETNLNCCYNRLVYHIEGYGDYSSHWKLCVCTYNEVPYYALKVPYHANPYTYVEFVGHVRSDIAGGSSAIELPLDIPYYNNNTSVILNEEVYNSITDTLTTTYVTSIQDSKLYCTAGFQGNLSGTATKATQDSAGQQINTTYIKGLSVNGKTITYTKGDDTTGTITTQDTDTHYTTKLYVGTSDGSANAATTNGNTNLILMDNSTVRNRVNIKGTGATSVTSDANGVITVNSTNTTYSVATTSANGLMSSTDKTNLNGTIKGLSVSGKVITYTKVDGTTGTITTQDTNTTYSNATTSAAGLMSAADKTKLDNMSSGYLPLTGGQLTGNLTFSGTQQIAWDQGAYRQRIYITDDDTVNTNVFHFQQSTNSGSSYTDLMTIKDNGEVVATKFTGALNGNAATATKLTTARNINGTAFDGSADITTANWGTARKITIGKTAKNVNGSADASWSLSEIGTFPAYNIQNGGSEKSYSKLCTMPANIGAQQGGLSALIMGGSNFGGQKIPLIKLSFSTRGYGGSGALPDNLVEAVMIGSGSNTGSITFIAKLNGSNVELWISAPSYPYPLKMIVFNNTQVTINCDASTTTAPDGTTKTYTLTTDATPIGTIMMWSTSTAPSGYLICNGAAVSRTTYAALFAVIGTTYGAGDGSTTFNLPNMQDKFVIGTSSSRAIASTGGASTVTLTTAQMPSHTHTQNSHNHTQNSHNHSQSGHTHGLNGHTHWYEVTSGGGGWHTHPVGTYNGATGGYEFVRPAGWSYQSSGRTTEAVGEHTHWVAGTTAGNTGNTTSTTASNTATTATNQATTATNQNTGGGEAHNNIPPYISMPYIIKALA